MQVYDLPNCFYTALYVTTAINRIHGMYVKFYSYSKISIFSGFNSIFRHLGSMVAISIRIPHWDSKSNLRRPCISKTKTRNLLQAIYVYIYILYYIYLSTFQLWSMYSCSVIRPAKGFHSKMNIMYYSVRPNILQFIDILYNARTDNPVENSTLFEKRYEIYNKGNTLWDRIWGTTGLTKK